MVDDGAFDPDPILASLNSHSVRYVVVGGLAVAFHGVIRATADLDLVIDPEWDNAKALTAAMSELDAREIDCSVGVISEEALVRRVDRRLTTRHGDVHLLHGVEGVPAYSELQPPALFDLAGVPVPVAQIDDLLAMKRMAGGAKDLIEIAELEALAGDD